MQKFNYPLDTMITDATPEKAYEHSVAKPTPEMTTKHGQLKNFVSELQFITMYWDPVKIPKLTVLYIGAGPGHHLVTLIRMFPTINWELYDLQQFAKGLYDLPNVTMYEKYFEPEDFPRYSMRNDVFLICDIRNLTYSQGGKTRWSWNNEKKALDDMKLQESWVLAIRPMYAYLKFRLPYAEKEVLTRLGKTWEYLDGLVYVQPWIGHTSSETRLIVQRPNGKDDYAKKQWDYSKFERQMYYHNSVRRLLRYSSDYKIEYSSDDRFVLGDYYDSVMTMEILASYLGRVYPDRSKWLKNLKPMALKILVPLANVEDRDAD